MAGFFQDPLNYISPLLWIPGVKDRLMSRGKYDPSNRAMPFLDEAKGLYDPFVQQGQDAAGQLNPMYSDMASDPGAYLAKLMQGYEESPYQKMLMDKGLTAAGNTAAAGGMRGSMQDTQGQANLAAQLSGQGMQDWLKNVYGLQGAGMQGLENTVNRGYGATSDQANILGSQGGLKFHSQQQQNQIIQDLIKSLLGNASSFMGMM